MTEYYHGTCTTVFRKGQILKPGLGLSAMFVHTGATLGADIDSDLWVECQGGEKVKRTDMVWLTTDIGEADDWALCQRQKASWADLGDRMLYPALADIVYEVEPLGPVYFPLEPHSPNECCTPKARVVREVCRDVWDRGENPYPDEED